MNNSSILLRYCSSNIFLLTPTGVTKLQNQNCNVVLVVPDTSNPPAAVLPYTDQGIALIDCWSKAPHDSIVIGFDEIPVAEFPITQQHFCFSSLFDENLPSSNILERLFWGNGILYDLYLLLKIRHNTYLKSGDKPEIITQHLENDFLPLLLEFIDNKKNPIWTEIEQHFTNKLANYQAK